MTLKCDPRKENILQLKIVRLSHFLAELRCGGPCPIFHDFCVIFLTSSSVVPIQKLHTRYRVTPAQSRPSPSSFVTALFIIPNPDSICCVSLVNIYNILHKCVMASQFPRNELFHVTMLQEMNNLKNRQDDAKELISENTSSG